jgi:type IV pilus assembly protein PilX
MLRSDPKLGQRRRSAGVALFISLVLLLMLTIIGVSAVQSTSLEVRMARNDHDSLLAFQAAESALRDAEDQLEGITAIVNFTDAGTNGLWTVADLGDPPRWEDPNVWDDAQSLSVVAPTNVPGVAGDPRYIIEHAATVIREENAYQIDDPYGQSASDRIEVFRITARGIGGTEQSRVMLQSTYGRILE